MVKDSSTLTVTAKGQVTFRRSVLDHLGVGRGDRLVVDLLPGGRATVHAAARGRIDDFIGALPQPEGRRISIEEMREVAAMGWAGKR
jgi:antitoxin PrlF